VHPSASASWNRNASTTTVGTQADETTNEGGALAMPGLLAKVTNPLVCGSAAIACFGSALAATAFALTSPASAQSVTLRMHTHVPPVARSFKNLDWWRQKVEKDSAGSLKIQLYGSMQLGGKAPDIYDQVKAGVVDIGWTLPGYKQGLFPCTNVFELPFIGDKADVVAPAVDAYIRKRCMKEWDAVHFIVAHTGGESVIHTKVRPIRKLEDFKGLKMRTPSRVSSQALEALGSTPVPIPGLKMTEALMRNVVDGAVAPWSISLAIRTIDAAQYHTESTLHEPVLIMIMNKASYAKLSAAAKKAIDMNSGEAVAKEFGRRWVEDDKPARAKALKLKHEVIELPKAEVARWRKAVQGVYDNWIKEMTANGHPGKELVADAEELIAKYAAEKK
jgi:TRAP-type C4-dicarboxylate transport system substrate-binding protein